MQVSVDFVPRSATSQVVIAFASRSLRPQERNMDNYSSFKLELLALKWAVTEKFRDYLLGGLFVVYMDNSPLSYLQTAKLGPTEMRWVAQFAQFNFKVVFRSSKSNANADALSRSFFVCCLAHRGSTVGFLLLQCSSGVVRYPRDIQVSVATRSCRSLVFASS